METGAKRFPFAPVHPRNVLVAQPPALLFGSRCGRFVSISMGIALPCVRLQADASAVLLSTVFTGAYNHRKVTDYSNPLRGIVPKVIHRDDVDETALVELIEKLEGEVAFDAYVKALMSTQEVTARITELENCLQRLANAVRASGLVDKGSGLRAATEEAAIVLKNRLEVADVASRIRKRVTARIEPFQDDLRLIKTSRRKAPDSNT